MTDFHAVVSADPNRGWSSLTPFHQRSYPGGKAAWVRFWTSVDRATLSQVQGGPLNLVQAVVTYDFVNGRRTQQRTVFVVADQAGQLRIDGSRVLS